MVDVDIDQVIDFCKRFDSEYIQPAQSETQAMKTVASGIESELRSTVFATKSSEKIMEMALKLERILDQGEVRIRELLRKAVDDRERGEEFSR